MDARVAAAVLTLAAGSAGAFTWDLKPPSAFDADASVMHLNLGLPTTFIEVEDFEDTSFNPALDISLIGTCTAGHRRDDDAQPWDGQWGYSNAIALTGDDGYTFHIQVNNGSRTVGVGFAHAGAGFRVLVNGIRDASCELIGGLEVASNIASDPDWATDGMNRNGYLVVRAEPGDPPITSVTLESLAPEMNDFVQIDHVTAVNCAGDINGDGVINFEDLNIVLANWGAACDQ